MDTWRTFVFLTVFHSATALSDPNVCSHREAYTEKVNVTYLKPYNTTTTIWCAKLIPRCTVSTTNYRIEFREEFINRYRTLIECCSGYQKVDNLCLPICSICEHGTCIQPNVCQCENDYGGPHCNISCPVNLWGDECQYDCTCKGNALCDVANGNCSCENGWTGAECDMKCLSGTYGKNCSQNCNCGVNECDHITGKCLSNYNIKEKPKRTTAIIELEKTCICKNNGWCNSNTNQCICMPGWEGTLCENTCSEGNWGLNCSFTCDCYNEAHCHHVSGRCICEAGFTGYQCLNTCPAGSYGDNCKNKCKCQNGGTCSNVDGACTCLNQWTGLFCDTNVCSYIDGKLSCLGIIAEDDCRKICGVYQLEKHQNCSCLNDNFVCDILKGCICKDGFIGSYCDISITTLLIIIGSVIGTISIVALVVLVTLIIRYLITRQITIPQPEECNLNHYRESTMPEYEEIKENSGYQHLIFGGPINGRNAQYQRVLTIPPNAPSYTP